MISLGFQPENTLPKHLEGIRQMNLFLVRLVCWELVLMDVEVEVGVKVKVEVGF